LYCESAEKYKATVEQGGNYVAFAFNNWGNALYDLAKLSQDNDFNKCLKEYVAAHSAIKDAPSYNLACVFALIGDKTNALFYLDKSLKKNEMFVKNVLKDKDWQTYLDDAEFQALLNRYRSGAYF
ncbi:MAG: hypothetical protein LBO72_07715, partial [Helicobacteraceae bacterium]|nr:hypothetical protein [Helicobacteraceae bacterium]